jgi:hypothetical protein
LRQIVQRDAAEAAARRHGFEEYRRDAEEGGGWYSLSRHSGKIFSTEEDARARASACVAWLQKKRT